MNLCDANLFSGEQSPYRIWFANYGYAYEGWSEEQVKLRFLDLFFSKKKSSGGNGPGSSDWDVHRENGGTSRVSLLPLQVRGSSEEIYAYYEQVCAQWNELLQALRQEVEALSHP